MSNVEQIEETRQRVASFEALVEDVVNGLLSAAQFPDKIKALGASAAEAEDYFGMLQQRLIQQRPARPGEGTDEVEGNGPPGDGDTQRNPESDEQRLDHHEAVEAAAWAMLQAKFSQLDQINNAIPSAVAFNAEDFARLLDPSRSASLSLPSSLLAIAPHLKELTAEASKDEHIQETWRLRQACSVDRTLDSLLSLCQLHNLPDPIPRSLWREIIKDAFVDFEKLYASMDRGYNHYDDPKEFAGGFSLVRKDHFSAKKPVRTESEWIRVFTCWSAGVCLVYRHRVSELEFYRKFVLDLFRAVPTQPHLAIGFDVDVRDKYSKTPFHLDDRSQLNTPLMVFLARSNGSSTSSSVSGAKRSSSSSLQQSKRTAVVCYNWNGGRCDEPCRNRRKHGSCSECGGRHRAKDEPACYVLFQARKAAFEGGSSAESGVGSGRA